MSRRGLVVRAAWMVLLAWSALVETAAFSQEPLRVGAIRYKTEADYLATFEPLVHMLAGELEREPELTLVEGDRLAYLLANGTFDLGIFTPFPYLQARLDFPELEVFASHEVGGRDTYQGAILVRSDRGIERLGDLMGKSFLFVKPTSTSGFKIPLGVLRENGLTLEESLRSYDFSGAHADSVASLLADQVDAIAVDLEALRDLTAGERASLRVLEEYEVPFAAYVFSPTLPATSRQRIMDAMFDARRNPDNAALFNNPLGIERWVEREDTFYNVLRRYLGMVRSKPQLGFTLKLKDSARQTLEAHGDLVDVLAERVENELLESGRFAPKSGAAPAAPVEVVLDIALVDESFHCQSYLNGRWLGAVDLALGELLSALPARLTDDVLEASPVTTSLLFNGSQWFISYGTEDGIDPDRYRLSITGESGDSLELPVDAVARSTPLNTFLAHNNSFRRGAEVVLTYQRAAGTPIGDTDNDLPTGLEGDSDEAAPESWLRRFWSNVDNRWGVIGLVIAALSVALGGYLKVRRQRRFRSVLNESLDLLRMHLEGKYDLNRRLVEQREKILHYLEKNFINENQYLILKHHLDEVEEVIGRLAQQSVSDTQEVQAELTQIVRDGKVTAEELEHLAAMLRENDGEAELVS